MYQAELSSEERERLQEIVFAAVEESGARTSQALQSGFKTLEDRPAVLADAQWAALGKRLKALEEGVKVKFFVLDCVVLSGVFWGMRVFLFCGSTVLRIHLIPGGFGLQTFCSG